MTAPYVRQAGERVAAAVPAPLRMGPGYWRWRRKIRAEERWPQEAWEVEQRRLVLRTLRFARDTVPFHRARIPAAVEDAAERDALRVLANVPPMTKDDVREHFDELWSSAVPPWRRRTVTTGGSTGAPVPLGLQRGTSVVEWAFVTSIWSRVGFRVGERRLMVRGLALQGEAVRERPFLDELQLSAFHLSDEHLQAVWARIAAYRPAWLHGYPSAITALLLWDREAVRSLGVRGVLCGSEPLMPWQRSLISDVLGAPVVHWYGHSERLLLGGECEGNQAFHIFPRYGYLEVLGTDGSRLPDGERGEIAGTALLSRAMPLIRYRTEDHGVLMGRGCAACGRQYPLLGAIEPHRGQEFLIGGSGAPISVTAINFHDASLVGVAGLQYVQDRPGEAVLRVKADRPLDEATIGRIASALRSKLAGEVSVSIEQVAHLERRPSGKAPLVLQRSAVTDPALRRLVAPDAGSP